MPTKSQSSSRTNTRRDNTVKVQVVSYDIQPDDEIIEVDDATARGARSSVASVASYAAVATGASQGSVASVASVANMISFASQSSQGSVTGSASVGSTASMSSLASAASLVSFASQGSAATTGTASRASRASVASAASSANPVYLNLPDVSIATPFTVIKTGTQALIQMNSNASETIDGKTRLDYDTQHTPQFVIPTTDAFKTK